MVTNTINDPTLKLGSQGEEVKELQRLLNSRIPSVDAIVVDGIFGLQTQAVLAVVQYQFLLQRDGIAGSLTWKSLRANAPVDKPTLCRGSINEQVSIVQQVLKAGKYYIGLVDGNFGNKTEAAIKALQKDKKLTVDGIIGDQTWKALSDLATFLSVD
jgi:peptidoglycan hydrolase-like protein with peptidoglycan-binding domain